MSRLTGILAACGIAVGMALGGCGDKGGHEHPHDESADHSHDGDAGHAEGSGHDGDASHEEDHDGAAGHDDDGHSHDGDAPEHSAEGGAHSLGSVKIGGVELAVASLGAFEAGSELHLDIRLVSGPTPSAVRVWVGEESGVGSMKSRLDAHESDMHGHVETSADLGESARLWFEVEAADGSKTLGSVALTGG